MASFRTGEDQYSPISEINITPLVDVMLVLLIIFMVTVPLLESGILIQLPKTSAKALPKDELPIVLHVTKDRRFFLNQDALLPSDLVRTLQKYFRNRAKKELFIRADESLSYGFVAQTMAAVKMAGIHKIGLVTMPPERGK